MSGTELVIVTRQQLEAGDVYRQWLDPAASAPAAPDKRAALIANPFSKPDDPAQIIGLLDNRVVGRMDVLPGEMSIRGIPERIFYGSGLFVEESARHTGIGLMILLKIQALHRTVGVCGISQMIHPIYEKLRWADFTMPRMVLVRRSRAALETVTRRPLAQAMQYPVDAALLLQRAFLKLRLALPPRGLTLEPVAAAPTELDAHLQRPADRIAPARSVAWLNWLLAHKFQDAPRLSRRLVLIKDRGGRIVGYFLTKSRFYESATQRHLRNITLGSVQDWQIFDAEKLDASTLLLLAALDLGATGVDAVEIPVPDPALATRLKRHGFVTAGHLNYLFRAAPGSPLANKESRDPANWLLRPAEGDNFFA